jgi:hypothetical protein
VLEGCFSSFPYGTCLLSVSVALKNTKHQYLAFDVSLPPPDYYLSCSPKQLDSGSKGLNIRFYLYYHISANVAVTLFGVVETNCCFPALSLDFLCTVYLYMIFFFKKKLVSKPFFYLFVNCLSQCYNSILEYYL